jgi:hypothetical protein
LLLKKDGLLERNDFKNMALLSLIEALYFGYLGKEMVKLRCLSLQVVEDMRYCIN